MAVTAEPVEGLLDKLRIPQERRRGLWERAERMRIGVEYGRYGRTARTFPDARLPIDAHPLRGHVAVPPSPLGNDTVLDRLQGAVAGLGRRGLSAAAAPAGPKTSSKWWACSVRTRWKAPLRWRKAWAV